MKYGTKALIMFSGGQDSATCLAWAIDKYDYIETVGFNYDQRHLVEMECRKTVLRKVRSSFPEWNKKIFDDHIVDLNSLGKISNTSLTRNMEITLNEEGLPSTFVPGRNLIFMNFAAAIAYRRGINTLIGGMCESDFSGYPDCRKETLDAQMKAISLGLDKEFILETPLMHMSKSEAWNLAEELGGKKLIDIIVEDSHSCYKGHRTTRYEWGYGCNACPACDLRSKGWLNYAS